MVLYDLIAPGYDLFFQALYRPYRARAFALLPQEKPGATALDLACGTGQNFPFLARCVGAQGTLIGIDLSSGMLRVARRRLANFPGVGGFLLRHDAGAISPEVFQHETKLRCVDLVVCAFGFSAMREWKIPFHRSFDLLRPGGRYLILDAHAEKRTLHVRAVEAATRSDFTRASWQFLEQRCPDFHMEYIDPSAYLFGGRVFVAFGTKQL